MLNIYIHIDMIKLNLRLNLYKKKWVVVAQTKEKLSLKIKTIHF